MQFFNLSEAEFYPKDSLVKPSAIKNLMMSVLCTAMLSGIPALIYFDGKSMPLFVFIIFQVVAMVVFLITFGNFLKSLKSDSWLMNIQAASILIKYRSYKNMKLPAEDKQIVYIDFTEIESVNKTTITRYTRSKKKGSYTRSVRIIHCLDIVLRSEQNDQLAQAIFNELGKRIQGKGDSSEISFHYPVSLIDSNILRIDFTGYKPSIGNTLEILSPGITVNDTKKITEDFSKSIEDEQQLREAVLQLMMRGERFAAKALVRMSRKSGLSETSDFIDEVINCQLRKSSNDIDELEVVE